MEEWLLLNFALHLACWRALLILFPLGKLTVGFHMFPMSNVRELTLT